MVADKIATLRDGQNKQSARIQPPAGKCEDVFAERKLAAYVGICEGDKELTDTVLPLVRQAIGELNDSSTALADLTKDAARRALEMRRVKRVLDHLDGGEPEAVQPLLNAWYRSLCERLAQSYGVQMTPYVDGTTELDHLVTKPGIIAGIGP